MIPTGTVHTHWLTRIGESVTPEQFQNACARPYTEQEANLTPPPNPQPQVTKLLLRYATHSETQTLEQPKLNLPKAPGEQNLVSKIPWRLVKTA